ncbi:hypothetical protein [Microvirga tunisiensis]|uniref:Toprim domain-containing protein n=1 Tax=Microvirga tunisiensis TaxID=2108360 RepID=A0A5N7MAU1_9HYPH|nr:hypothetical protein [Microvirga tunisiensis]MPR05677.1 hypothetical protein [Microvirga tunisiensis]MPR23877.1 hypothetical protein [Microvirga tunisiensis]
MARWTAETLAYKLSSKPRRTASGFMTVCPAHKDKGPSLSLSDTRNGRVLFNCMANCAPMDVIASLMNLGIDLRTDEEKARKKSNFKAEAVADKPAQPKRKMIIKGADEKEESPWVYAPHRASEREPKEREFWAPKDHTVTDLKWIWHSKDGLPVFRTYRTESAGGKDVLPLIPCEHKDTKKLIWKVQAPPTPRILYDLHLDPENVPVLVVEGEKTVDAAKKIFGTQLWATTSQGGGKAAHLADWSPLKGRKVIIADDLDGPGIAYASIVHEQAKIHGALSVHLWNFPAGQIPENGRLVQRLTETKKGYDLDDARQEGWTLGLIAVSANPYPGAAVVSI